MNSIFHTKTLLNFIALFGYFNEFVFIIRDIDHGKTLHIIDRHFIKNINSVFVSCFVIWLDYNYKIFVFAGIFPIRISLFLCILLKLFTKAIVDMISDYLFLFLNNLCADVLKT